MTFAYFIENLDGDRAYEFVTSNFTSIVRIDDAHCIVQFIDGLGNLDYKVFDIDNTHSIEITLD